MLGGIFVLLMIVLGLTFLVGLVAGCWMFLLGLARLRRSQGHRERRGIVRTVSSREDRTGGPSAPPAA